MKTKQAYKFLLPVDGSLHGIRAAEYLAHYAALLGPTEVCVVNVQTTTNGYSLDRAVRDEPNARATVAAESACKYLQDMNVPYYLHTEVGEPAAGIARQIRLQSCDEVIMGTRGMGTILNLAVGSTAYKMIHLADVPLTLVSIPLHKRSIESSPAQADAAEMHRVLLAVDGSTPALRAVQYVCELPLTAVPLDVQLLNVPLPILSGNVRQFISQETIDAYHLEQGDAALNAAKAALQAKGVSFRSHIVAGPAADVIVDQADKLRCSRIVLGSRGLGAVASLLLGSVAFKVVQLANIPVTLVK